MAAYRPLPALERLHAAQGRPLIQRCHIMSDILNTTSTKELKTALPYILHEIFDFEKDQTQGWQLDRIFRSYSTDLFDHIRQFLSPEGPLMKVINSLQADPYAVYEFPLKYIPAPARQMIEEGAVPTFYANKLQGQSFSSAVLMLNILFNSLYK
ncbi:sphingomyelin phosphodiesterase 4 [Plakobranchus ocellatus]|uniref:Sphingomyelin phosphodiesterase 4 n=1 Tax=Plakobranchus ocellatus TaxID=259542 RepID=A0AAV3YT22_9GAST|nr:sphingomyelin phosphodiesterase 4 [Plakobranchus ocellatus]